MPSALFSSCFATHGATNRVLPHLIKASQHRVSPNAHEGTTASSRSRVMYRTRTLTNGQLSPISKHITAALGIGSHSTVNAPQSYTGIGAAFWIRAVTFSKGVRQALRDLPCAPRVPRCQISSSTFPELICVNLRHARVLLYLP
jgi:hypothetical protein